MNVREMVEERKRKALAQHPEGQAVAPTPPLPQTDERLTPEVPPRVKDTRFRSGETLKDRLTKLSKTKSWIAFLVKTPGSTHGRLAHAVLMKDFEVKRTNEGQYVVVGRDAEEEVKKDIELNRTFPAGHRRTKAECEFRSYRLDRIVPRTLFAK